jgi:carboxymethylenebutenolidase
MVGAVALLAAMHLTEADAAVIFYGIPLPEPGDPATIEIPILCHFAKRDAFFTPEKAAQLEARMQDGKVPYKIYWYDAEHGFCNPNPNNQGGLGHYNPEAAHLAWERTLEFWQHALHKGSMS